MFKSDLAKWSQVFKVVVTVDKADGMETDVAIGLITNLVPDLQIPSLEDTRVIIVGPPIMMKYTALEFLRRGIAKENIWVSFERKMSCGLGKCGHCKIDETYVCLEGPVFNFIKAQTLLD